MTFRFASPYFFLLFLIFPFIIYFQRDRRLLPTLRVSSTTIYKKIKTSFYIRIEWIVEGLKILSLGLIIIALARPQWGNQQINILSEGINIILAIDASETMRALDFKRDGKMVTRLDAVKFVVNDFISKRKGDRIGMVVFGSEAYTQMPLTRDYNTISTILDKIQIGAAGPNTAIGDAIGISIKRLSNIKSKSNIIILLTDGQSNSGELTPESAAQISSQKGIKIYTIGIGGKGEAPFLIKHPFFGDQYIYQKVDIDENTLKNIAQTTGGLYFNAQDLKALEKIYETIDRLEKTEVKTKVYAEYKELYKYLVIPAFIMLCIWIVLTNTRFLRVP